MKKPKVASSSNMVCNDEALQDPMNHPSSGPSTVRIPAFLNSLPRWLLKIECGFQGFLRSILRSRGRSDVPTSMSRSTWPMPLPHPEVFCSGAQGTVADAHLKRLVCLQVALLDWFVLGRPTAAPRDLALGSKLSSRQWTAVRMLRDLAVDGNTPEFIEAEDMGRSAAKNEDHEAVLGCLCRAASMGHVFDYCGGIASRPDFFDDDWFRCGSLVGRCSRGDNAKAKALVADRITVPDCPRFDPVPHFDRKTAERYMFPLTKGKKPHEVVGPVPNVQIRATPSERLRLFKKLAGAGMLKPIEKGSFYQGFENGMFGVNKDAARDRLVLDSRAANMLDKGQSLWSGAMAAASSLALLYLEDHRVLVASGEDLKDYFYQFVVNGERTSRNALKATLSQAEYAEVFGHAPTTEDEVHFVGLSTLAMGDVCAVEYHTSVAPSPEGCFKLESLWTTW